MVQLLLSLLLLLLVAVCYLLRPIACAATTVFPVWVWLLPGLFLAGLGWRRLGQHHHERVSLSPYRPDMA